MAKHHGWRSLDWALVILALLIAGIGIIQIYSATHGTIWRNAWWKQALWVVLGLIVMWVVASIDYHTLLGQAPLFYVLAIISLIAVLFFGVRVFGSRRWIPMPGEFLLQPSEFVKVVVILLVARYLAELKTERLEIRDLLNLGGLVGLLTLLVMRQPDLGTALTYLPILAAGVFMAGLRWKHWVAICLVGLLVLPLGWMLLKDYQKERLTTFLDPGRDPLGAGYQVTQSKIAVGSGGIWGKGVAQGSQTQLRFLPVPHTDFILAAFAEEHGFIGVLLILGLFFFLIMQIVQNAQMAPDRGGMYICLCIAGLILFHLLVNVGMVVGRMPVTGIPLPLMSYGGSSILTIFAMLGLVHNVRLRRFLN